MFIAMYTRRKSGGGEQRTQQRRVCVSRCMGLRHTWEFAIIKVFFVSVYAKSYTSSSFIHILPFYLLYLISIIFLSDNDPNESNKIYNDDDADSDDNDNETKDNENRSTFAITTSTTILKGYSF